MLQVIRDLEAWLVHLTGYHAVSLQPNAGSQGELAGLLAIRAHHRAHGETQRDVCLIPSSAHGTNAASAVMAGMKVAVVKAREDGAVDLDDLAASDRVVAEQDRVQPGPVELDLVASPFVLGELGDQAVDGGDVVLRGGAQHARETRAPSTGTASCARAAARRSPATAGPTRRRRRRP